MSVLSSLGQSISPLTVSYPGATNVLENVPYTLLSRVLPAGTYMVSVPAFTVLTLTASTYYDVTLTAGQEAIASFRTEGGSTILDVVTINLSGIFISDGVTPIELIYTVGNISTSDVNAGVVNFVRLLTVS